jgi:hypothetical protein
MEQQGRVGKHMGLLRLAWRGLHLWERVNFVTS